MLHFAPNLSSSSGTYGHPKRQDASQPTPHSNTFTLKIEEELHDARRVQSYGQEEDLRAALAIVINRVAELSSLLNEAYKTQADLEVQLNVTKSNLQLVISNNEMLEEALGRETNGQTQGVGWHRRSGRDPSVSSSHTSDGRRRSLDSTPGHEGNANPSAASPKVPSASPAVAPSVPSSSRDNRFFGFRFTGSSSTATRPATRPPTPSGSKGSGSSGTGTNHLASSSMPALPLTSSKEIEELTSELEKERGARKNIAEEKAALESELESLSQALFEEANKMVATERMKRAEMEEELKEAKLEQEALRNALRHLASIGQDLDEDTTEPQTSSSLLVTGMRPRSSSQVAIKSPAASPRSSSSDIPPMSAEPQANDPVASSGQLQNGSTAVVTDPPLDDSFSTPVAKSFMIQPLEDGADSTDFNHSATYLPLSSSHPYEAAEPSPWGHGYQ